MDYTSICEGYFIIPLVTCSPFQPFLLPHHIHHPLQLLGGHFFTKGKKNCNEIECRPSERTQSIPGLVL